MKIVPSLLAASCNFTTLKKQLSPLLKNSLIDSVHIDVMDGKFVKNNTLQWMTPELVKKLKKTFPNLKIGVHLMVQYPEEYVEGFAIAGARRIYIHVESKTKKSKLATIKKRFKRVEFAPVVNPETSEKELKGNFKSVLVMSVHPGKGGQRFLTYVYQKLRRIRKQHPRAIITVDGGVYLSNVNKLAKIDIDEVIAGTAVFKGNSLSNVKKLRAVIK